MSEMDERSAQELGKVSAAGDRLAAAAARVCSEYDGVHRLRAALSEWFDVRAGVHGTGETKSHGRIGSTTRPRA